MAYLEFKEREGPRVRPPEAKAFLFTDT